MDTRVHSSVRAILAILSVAIFFLHPFRSHAHHCGEPEITLRVGEQTLWVIIADRLETESFYQILPPLGDNSTLFPSVDFFSRHGMFMITGKTPGTNHLSVRWLYPANQAQGICTVRVTVLPAESQQETDGYLPGYAPSIMFSYYQLETLMQAHISPQVQLLLIATHSLGYQLALSTLRNRANTVILSATSHNQRSYFGGYHDDAARALLPLINYSAWHMHLTAMIGSSYITPPRHGDPIDISLAREWSEWPGILGSMRAEDFSLEPTTVDGDIRRRAIILYDPKPKLGYVYSETIDGATIPSDWGILTEFGTSIDHARIKTNFAGQVNTRIITIGGAPATMGSGLGKNGFDYSADHRGWGRAFEDAGNFLKDDPAHSQLIMYLSGSGGIGSLPLVENDDLTAGMKYELPADSLSKLGATISLSTRFTEPRYVYADLALTAPDGSTEIEEPSDTNTVRLVIEPEGGTPQTFNPRRVRLDDFNGNGIPDFGIAEALHILYQVPVENARSLSETSGTAYLENDTGHDYTLRSFRWTLPALGRSDAPRTISYIDSATRNENGSVSLNLRGNPGDAFELERTSDFKSWQSVETIFFKGGAIQYTDSGASSLGASNYRLRWINQ